MAVPRPRRTPTRTRPGSGGEATADAEGERTPQEKRRNQWWLSGSLPGSEARVRGCRVLWCGVQGVDDRDESSCSQEDDKRCSVQSTRVTIMSPDRQEGRQ